jgi:prepilin-type processing-associated H-X9-DG protein
MSSVVIYRIGHVNAFASFAKYFAYRHSGGLNVLFLDGHVDWKTKREDGYPHGFYFYEGGSFFD